MSDMKLTPTGQYNPDVRYAAYQRSGCKITMETSAVFFWDG